MGVVIRCSVVITMRLVKGKDNFTVRHYTCLVERRHVYDGHVSSWEDELQ